jgi:tRNA threonylcarbamoyladenosine biosynthesis protein TsaE
MSTVLIWQTTSTGSADTMRLGKLVGAALSPPVLVELVSDLGGGKTTFVTGLAKGLKSSDQVSSPTFTLKKIYKAPHLDIFHYDFYRLRDPGIMRDELAESLNDPKVITVVEWSDIVTDVLPSERLTIKFEPTANDSEERQITVHYPESWTGKMRQIETEWAVSQP